jgi:cobalt-zinc-cadmium efflux system membrane fusion protein
MRDAITSDTSTNHETESLASSEPMSASGGVARPNPRFRQWVIVGAVALLALVAVVVVALWLRSGSANQPTEKTSREKTGNSPSEVKLSPEALKAAGIEIEGVTQRPAVALLKVTGTVETNPQQTQQTTMLVSGRVERVTVVIGDRVRAGLLLAVVSSPEVAEMHGKLREAETRLQLAERNLARVQRAENRVAVLQAKAKLDEADATLKRTRRLIELGVGAGKDLVSAEASYKAAKAEFDFQSNISLNREVQQAQAEVETARVDAGHIRQSLVTLGAHLTEGERDNPNENIARVNVRAPVSGTVTERLVNAGAGIQPGMPLFTIANLSNVWVIANVPEAQVGSLHIGTPAELRSAGLGRNALAGQVNYIDPKLNEETRTARVRVELANPGERLKAGMFVEVGFQTNTGAGAGEELMVPSTAVQRIGDRSVVFIPKEGAEGTFEARDVELGCEVDGYHRVLSGLKVGDRVVTKGSFTLKTQLMKGALGEE